VGRHPFGALQVGFPDGSRPLGFVFGVQAQDDPRRLCPICTLGAGIEEPQMVFVVRGKRIGGWRYIGDHGITLCHIGASQIDEERFTAQSGKFNRFCTGPSRKKPPGSLRAGCVAWRSSVALAAIGTGPDEAAGLGAFGADEVGEDRRVEARVVELDREVVAALGRALRPPRAYPHLLDIDAVARRVFVGPAHGNDADVLGTETEGKDIAQVLAVANALEGTDGSHVVSPWLSEPATIAVSMAIKRPQAVDDAPVRAGAQRRMAGERLSCLREEWAKPRGRKSQRRHCGKAIEAQPSCGQIASSMRTASSRARRPLGRRRGTHGATQEPAPQSEKTETLAYGKAS
jgi:hypothetical protein